ncbi:MAG: hypothetical protein V8S24_14480 [Gordonibacter pamelaeae]
MKTKRAWIVAFATIFAGISLALVQNKVAPCMTTLMGAFNIDMATAGWRAPCSRWWVSSWPSRPPSC